MFRRFAFFAAACLVLSACAISQTAQPVTITRGAEVCIVRNADVRENFHQAIETSLRNRGFTPRTLDAGATPRSCPTTITYTANWNWDVTMYMTYARINAYSNGTLAGNAEYDSRRAGMSLNKWVNAEAKVDEMIGQLFPQ